MTPEQHKLAEMVRDYENTVYEKEQQLVSYALQHGLSLSLGDYGSGRTLIVKDGHWSGKDRGEWLYSSETC